jgi:hypothetical protein
MDNEVSAEGYEGVYDGQAHGITVTAPEGATIKYGISADKCNLDASPAYKDVGEYTVYFKITKQGYAPITGSRTVEITPATITVTADDQSKAYGATDPALTYEASGAVGTEAAGFTGALTRDAGEDVGTYTIRQGDLALADNAAGNFKASNYTLDFVNGTLTITEANGAALAITDYSGVYDGQSHSITVGELPEAGNTIEYSLDETNWSSTLPTFTDVGKVTVYVKVTNPNYNERTGSGTVEITPRPITITAASASKTYDGTPLTNNAYTYTTQGDDEGVLESLGHQLIDVVVTGTQLSVGNSPNVATGGKIVAPVETPMPMLMSDEGMQFVDVTDNYAITYVDGIFTVTRRSSGGGGSGTVTIPDEEVPGGPLLNMTDHFAYVQGYPDNTVRSQSNITREEVAAVFFRLLDPAYRETIRTTDVNFTDVKSDRWSAKHIGTLSNGQIITGYVDGSFRPSNNITRAELATIASRFDNLSDPGEITFSDVNGHWG